MPIRKSQNPSVASYLEKLTGPQRDTVLQLREVVLGANSDITEAIKWKNCLTFEFGGSNIIQTVVGKKHTTLIFFEGTGLKDPRKLLFGEGKKVRSARFSDSKIDVPALTSLVKQAVKLSGK